MEQISETEIKNQAYKYYLLIIAWPIYLLLLPMIYSRSGWTSVLFMVFPGAYLYVWLACLMHECWHKYTPNVNNDFYDTFSFMLITDPQIYKILHGHHHSKLHTWQDREFHPLGYIQNPVRRRLYNLAEILLGVIWTVVMQMHFLPKHELYKPKYSKKIHRKSVAAWIIIYGGIGSISAFIFGLSAGQVIIPFAVNFWIGSLFLHHIQLLEHGGLIVEGDYHQRNTASRNLRRNGIAERIFHFITHGDARQHILHHTLVKLNSRPFPYRVSSPDDAIFISMRQYTAILWQMVAKG